MDPEIPAEVRVAARAYDEAQRRLPKWVGDLQTEIELIDQYVQTLEADRPALLKKWKDDTVHFNTFTVVRINVKHDGINLNVDESRG